MRTFWFIAKTKWGRERYARSNVMRQDVCISTFLPMIEGQRGKEEKMFPGYLFVLTYGQWRFLENTYGCTGVVMMGDTAAVLAHRHMRELRSRVKDEQAEYNVRHIVRYKYDPNQKVRVTQGSYAGIEGLYSHTSSEKRICIMLSLLGRKVLVEQDAKHVTAADPEVIAA